MTETGKPRPSSQPRADQPTFTLTQRRRHLAVAASVAALGGLLFGYDTGIIASAQLYFTPEFGLSSTMQEVTVASLLAGAVVGVLIGGPATDRFGRKTALQAGLVVFALAAFAASFGT